MHIGYADPGINLLGSSAQSCYYVNKVPGSVPITATTLGRMDAETGG